MDELDNYTVDILRRLQEFGRPLAVDVAINHFYRYRERIKSFSKQIHDNIISNHWADVSEGNKLMINDSGINYITIKTTDEYIVDRCLDILKQKPDSSTDIDELLTILGLKKMDDKKKKHLEAIICESGLIEFRGRGYGYVLQLNHKGIIELEKFDTYSDYLTNLENKNRMLAPVNITGNKGSVFYQSPVSESIINTTVEPTVTPKKKMNITKIIAIISGIITIMLGLYFLYDRYLK